MEALTGSILIVDDNASNLRLLRSIFEDTGCQIRLANSGKMALSSLDVKPVDLILLDVRMPDMDGYEVCKTIKGTEGLQDIPIVFISAASETFDKVRAFTEGAVDYITKPFKAEEVLARVQTHLRLALLQRELVDINSTLEERVKERTEELVETNEKLKEEMAARQQAAEEKEELQQQLFQSQKMEAIGQLAGGVAHDFNNILTAIFCEAQLAEMTLETEPDSVDDVKSKIDHILESAKRAAGLVRQLLVFSRRDVVQVEVFDLNKVLCDLEKLLRRLLTEDIEFKTVLDPCLNPIRADAGQIEQVVMNLVVNAKDAMEEGGVLILKTSNEVIDESYVSMHAEASIGPHVILSVSDTGRGMSREVVERIFEPFFTTKPAGKGTGLGLATTYAIVKRFGGHIRVYSEIGRGTTFKIVIPSAEEAAIVAEAAVGKDEYSTGTETVLVCEDDEVVRNLTGTMLSEVGYTVLEAENGERAIALAQKHCDEISLLIADVIMPRMNGRELSLKLNDFIPNLKTLFVSGYPSDVISHHGVLDEDVEFLEKPFGHISLLRKVREVLDK